MKKDYLSREEDELFSRTVLDFNNSSQANEKEKNAIRERTKILIYIVARDMLHLSYDDASTVFLDMEKELDKIITGIGKKHTNPIPHIIIFLIFSSS